MTGNATHNRVDVAIVGGGILGLAHAYLAAKQGLSVAVFEKRPAASGASIRNFGLIWPIGQPAGEPLRTALRSREIWGEVIEKAKLWHKPGGSLHVAHHDDEWQIINEFTQTANQTGYDCEAIGPKQVAQLNPNVRQKDLRGGLHSKTEIQVAPQEALARLPEFLREQFKVKMHYQTCVTEIDLPRVQTSRGEWLADRVVICGGDDFETLFPEIFQGSGLIRCKLQMMRLRRTTAAPFGLCVAGGLTLRFYKSFQSCASLDKFKRRIQTEMPEHERWGIHVMAAETASGELIVGDSHEYGLDPEPFDKPEIDELILQYFQSFLDPGDFSVTRKWNGVYSKHPAQQWFRHCPFQNVEILTGIGGAGMTLSFGLADQTVRSWK